MGREDTKSRREERRAQVARERAEYLENLVRDKRIRGRQTFSAKARKGDALEIRFQFSGVPVPVARPDDPDGDALVRATKDAKPEKDQKVN